CDRARSLVIGCVYGSLNGGSLQRSPLGARSDVEIYMCQGVIRAQSSVYGEWSREGAVPGYRPVRYRGRGATEIKALDASLDMNPAPVFEVSLSGDSGIEGFCDHLPYRNAFLRDFGEPLRRGSFDL